MKNSLDPIDMAKSFQKGEEKGFTYFFCLLRKPLIYFANTFLKDKEMSEDVVEESFIKIWELRVQFDHHMVIRSWLYTTVRNASLNKKKETSRIVGDLPESGSYNMLDKIKDGVYYNMVVAVNQLPQQCRRIVLMRYIEDKSVKDICKDLKLKRSTVKNQLARGMHKMRKTLHLDENEIILKRNRWIKRIFLSDGSNTSIAKLYGVSYDYILDIKAGRMYRSVTKEFS